MADSEKESHPGIRSLSPIQVLLNYLVANVWIGPVVTVYWVSTWQLIDTVLILPHEKYTSIWISFAIAVGGVFLASCFQGQSHKLANAFGKVWFLVFSHIYVYLLAFASVNQWRCFWHGWDFYTSSTTANGVATFFGAFVVLSSLGCAAKLMAAPAVTDIDVPPSHFFVMTTYAGTQPGTFKHVIDSLFTASFLPFLVATVWRGFWVICDRNLSPDDITTSALYNLLTAYGLGGFLICTRILWVKVCSWAEGKHWLGKYLVEDFHLLLQTIAAISHWKGFWMLLLNHVMCFVEWRYWVGHAVSFGILSACFANKSLLTTGCPRDGVRPHGMGIDLDIYYFSKMLQYWKPDKYSVLDEDTEGIRGPDKKEPNENEKKERMPVLDMNDKTTRYVSEN